MVHLRRTVSWTRSDLSNGRDTTEMSLGRSQSWYRRTKISRECFLRPVSGWGEVEWGREWQQSTAQHQRVSRSTESFAPLPRDRIILFCVRDEARTRAWQFSAEKRRDHQTFSTCFPLPIQDQEDGCACLGAYVFIAYRCDAMVHNGAMLRYSKPHGWSPRNTFYLDLDFLRSHSFSHLDTHTQTQSLIFE